MTHGIAQRRPRYREFTKGQDALQRSFLSSSLFLTIQLDAKSFGPRSQEDARDRTPGETDPWLPPLLGGPRLQGLSCVLRSPFSVLGGEAQQGLVITCCRHGSRDWLPRREAGASGSDWLMCPAGPKVVWGCARRLWCPDKRGPFCTFSLFLLGRPIKG